MLTLTVDLVWLLAGEKLSINMICYYFVEIYIKPVNPKEISPEYSLERLMLELKLQYFGYLMRRMALLKKTLMLGKIEGGRRRG